MKVLCAPDWRANNPYQQLLADALRDLGIETEFLSTYRRGLPLWRGSRAREADVLHQHWPEAYFLDRHDGLDALRVWRYPLDVTLAARVRPMVYTAHNLVPHEQGGSKPPGIYRNMKLTVQRAAAVFAHSAAAADLVCETFSVGSEKCRVIPFGDHSVPLGPPLPMEEARAALGLPSGPLCLVFGTISPYKGSDEIIRAWRALKPGLPLYVVGSIISEAYAAELAEAAGGDPDITIVTAKWLSDDELRIWLSAADATIFNYRKILTSGAACLARSYGIPVLLPGRLNTVDLGEPNARVFRFAEFDNAFVDQIHAALELGRDYGSASDWREATSWQNVAALTAEAYRNAA